MFVRLSVGPSVTQLGKWYVVKQRGHVYYVQLQEGSHRNYSAHQQHTAETADAKTPNPRQIQQIRRIHTNTPGLQGVCRADGTKFHTQI